VHSPETLSTFMCQLYQNLGSSTSWNPLGRFNCQTSSLIYFQWNGTWRRYV